MPPWPDTYLPFFYCLALVLTNHFNPTIRIFLSFVLPSVPLPHTFSFCLLYSYHINNETQIIFHVWAYMSPPQLWQSLVDTQSKVTHCVHRYFYRIFNEHDISVNDYDHTDKIRVAIFNLSSKTTAKHCNWTFWLLLMRFLSSDLYFLLVPVSI